MFELFDKNISQFRHFFQDIALLNGRKPKLHELLILLQLKPGLTQDELMKITNYSRGAISGYLTELQDFKLVSFKKDSISKKKKYIPLTKKLLLDYKYYYPMGSHTDEIYQFMTGLMKKFDSLIKKQNLKDNDAPSVFLYNRLKEFYNYFVPVKAYGDAVKNYKEAVKTNNDAEQQNNSFVRLSRNAVTAASNAIQSFVKKAVENPTLTVPEYESDIPDYLLSLETEFHEFLTQSNFFSELDPNETIVFGFLLTRGRLSLTTLSSLTGISAGTMSKILKNFCKMEVVHYLGKREGYSMISFMINWMAYRFYFYHQQMEWESKLKENFVQLKKFSPELVDADGFSRIYAFYAQILFILNQSLQVYHNWKDIEVSMRNAFQNLYGPYLS